MSVTFADGRELVSAQYLRSRVVSLSERRENEAGGLFNSLLGGAPELSHLFNGNLKIRQRHGTRMPSDDQL